MIEAMGLAAGCLLIYLGALYATMAALRVITDYREQSKWDHCSRYISNELSSMARWCAHEFPLIDDVAKEIISNLNSGGLVCDNSSFRDRLRAKYLKKEEIT